MKTVQHRIGDVATSGDKTAVDALLDAEAVVGGPVPARGRRRHDRGQCPDPGADGVPLLRRMEGPAVRGVLPSTDPKASASTRGPRSSPQSGRTLSTRWLPATTSRPPA